MDESMERLLRDMDRDPRAKGIRKQLVRLIKTADSVDKVYQKFLGANIQKQTKLIRKYELMYGALEKPIAVGSRFTSTGVK